MPLRRYQKKSNWFWIFLALIALAVEYALLDYDKWYGNDDGFIKGFYITHSFRYLWALAMLIFIITSGITSKIVFLQNVMLSFAGLVIPWLILELLFFVMLKYQFISGDTPKHRLIKFDTYPHKSVSGDFSAHFGRWSTPNESSQRPRPAGDSIWLYYNNVGARDFDRDTLKSDKNKKRIVVLGDSFVEGYMLDTAQRFTNLLEKQTKREHLNFGINGTSPIDHYLKYKYLVKQFDHDIILCGILPANDFDTYEAGRKMSLFDYPIYRPYWEQTTKGYQLRYSLAHVHHSIGSYKSLQNPQNVTVTVDSLYKTLGWQERIWVEISQNSYLYKGVMALSSKFNSFKTNGKTIYESPPAASFMLLEHNLKLLSQEAKGKKIILLVFPIENDVNAYQISKQNNFTPQLAKICAKYGFDYIDFLPYFAQYKGSQLSNLYTQGDGHWSAKGDSLVAAIIAKHPAYQKALQ
jgi:hypothetical protein